MCNSACPSPCKTPKPPPALYLYKRIVAHAYQLTSILLRAPIVTRFTSLISPQPSIAQLLEAATRPQALRFPTDCVRVRLGPPVLIPDATHFAFTLPLEPFVSFSAALAFSGLRTVFCDLSTLTRCLAGNDGGVRWMISLCALAHSSAIRRIVSISPQSYHHFWNPP